MPCKENAIATMASHNNNNNAVGSIESLQSTPPRPSPLMAQTSVAPFSEQQLQTSLSAPLITQQQQLPTATQSSCAWDDNCPVDNTIRQHHRGDVDALVHEMKLSLRLAESRSTGGTIGRAPLVPRATPEVNVVGNCGGGKMAPNQFRQRAAPYFVPSPRGGGAAGGENCDSGGGCVNCKSALCVRLTHRSSGGRHGSCSAGAVLDSDGPTAYRLLQELLKQGGLIKEAVRRINVPGEDEADGDAVGDHSMDDDTGGAADVLLLKSYDYEKDDYEETSVLLHGLEALM